MKTVFNKSDIYTQLTIKEAEFYLNKKGFFADTLEDLETAARRNNYGVLQKIYDKTDKPFKNSEAEYESFSLFIPAEKVIKIDDSKEWSNVIEINAFYKNIILSICDWALNDRKRKSNTDWDNKEALKQIERIEDFKSHFIEQIKEK
jgi:hypothetical protein